MCLLGIQINYAQILHKRMTIANALVILQLVMVNPLCASNIQGN